MINTKYTNDMFNGDDDISQSIGRKTGGGFPPLKGGGEVPVGKAELPGNDVGNPVSTGRGGLRNSLRIKNAGSKSAPGLEKNVNLF